MTKTLSAAQQATLRQVEGMRPLITQVGRKLWDLAEVGLTEYHSCAYLSELYHSHGFDVRVGIAGFPTGFIAEYGSGKPVIALLCEYDALPAMSTVQAGGSGHGCGHNLYGASSTGCALLLRKQMEKYGIKGTLRVYGTPGEENYASKAYYVNQGLFDDVDCSVGFHAGDENKVNYCVAAATYIRNFTFHGKPAHAGNYPWLGNSALDAVEIMNVACNYMREHVRPDTRIQYIITKGGDAYNIVPELAASQYVVRAADVPYMEEVMARVEKCAQAAALATGCTYESQYIDKTYNTVLPRAYAELAQYYLELVGAPQYSPDELAEAVKYGDGSGMHTAITPLPAVEGYKGGATDEGDVSWVVPHVSIYVANIAKGTTIHSLPATCQMNLPAAYTAALTQVSATAVMLLELLEKPETLQQIKADHVAKMGELSYPKNPDYKLEASFNPNCAGFLIQGNEINANFDEVVLLPKENTGEVRIKKTDGTLVGVMAASGAIISQVQLSPGDNLCIYCNDQLIGYYNL